MTTTQTAAAPKPARATAPTSRLSAVSRGVIDAPDRIALYGDNGVGKTTLAAGSDDPIFVDIEDGSGHLDVPRYSFRDEAGGHVPRTFEEFETGIVDLATNPHSFKTVVIDTTDRLEALLWASMVERDSGSSRLKGRQIFGIEDYGYAKGYDYAVDEWRKLLLKLDGLRARGMTVVLLAHAQVKPFKNPEGDDYDRWSLRMHAKAGGLLKEWVDINGFVRFEETSSKLDPKDKGERARGVSTGRRLLCTERQAAYDAKSRWAIPAEIELPSENPWSVFGAALKQAKGLKAPQLVDLIVAECKRLNDDEVTKKVGEAMRGKETDLPVLHRILNRLKSKQSNP
jgi:AAA domain